MTSDRTATKNDIEKLRTEMNKGVVKLEARVEDIEEVQKRIDVKLDKLQNTLDKFVGIVDDLRTENSVGAYHTRELQLKILELEKRVKLLEASKN
jgi:wobble nucleotide-excising tRNase